MIDFGLSKRYKDDLGRVIPRKEGRAGFRGSTAYASVYAHEELEQGDEPSNYTQKISYFISEQFWVVYA